MLAIPDTITMIATNPVKNAAWPLKVEPTTRRSVGGKEWPRRSVLFDTLLTQPIEFSPGFASRFVGIAGNGMPSPNRIPGSRDRIVGVFPGVADHSFKLFDPRLSIFSHQVQHLDPFFQSKLPIPPFATGKLIGKSVCERCCALVQPRRE